MTRAGGLAVLVTLLSPNVALAGPWTLAQGEAQVILKWEEMSADQGFDASGQRQDLLARRTDSAMGVFAEYGLTDRLTLQLKGDWQDGLDAFSTYQGRGPVELGLTWQVHRGNSTAFSVYGGYADGGDARNAGYAQPGIGDRDWELRASFGASRDFGQRRWGPDKGFVDVQVARRWREGLRDEVRMDATTGVHFGENWLVLAQAFGGVSDDDGPQWLSLETSVVRRFGDWSVQGGWREATWGRDTPAASGPVIGIWRRF